MKSINLARGGCIVASVAMLAMPAVAQAQSKTWQDTTHDVIINYAEHGGGGNAAPEDIETVRADYSGGRLAIVVGIKNVTADAPEHLAVHLHIKVSDTDVYGATLKPNKSQFVLHNVTKRAFKCGSTGNTSSFNGTADTIRVNVDRSCLPTTPSSGQPSGSLQISLDTLYTGTDFTRFDPYPNAAGSFSPILAYN